MKHDEKAREKFIDDMVDFINNVPQEWKADFAYRICCQAVIFGAYNDFEILGILEMAKLDTIETSKMVAEEERAAGKE